MTDHKWLTIEDVASYLSIKRDTLYKWIYRKDFPAHKVGRLWRFRIDEVDDWVRGEGARSTKVEKD